MTDVIDYTTKNTKKLKVINEAKLQKKNFFSL